MQEKHYRAAAYCRMSREDGDTTESESIANQRHIIEDFCKRHPKMDCVAAYADDGFTGTNFDRPDFKRMLADIEAGRINCVIVKDLSRFGRDYIDTGYYLERYFPERCVRFLALHEGIDSEQGPYDMMLPLRNVFNAQYAKDVSDKVRKSIRAKQARGESVRAFAPYGYAKDPGDKNRLVIDPEAAEIVRRIFDLADSGRTCGEIARTLNLADVASPLEYKRRHHSKLCVGSQVLQKCYWAPDAVKRILRNPIYIGDMVSNQYPSDVMHGKTRLARREEWIVVEGTHAPIISKERWDAVQARLGRQPRRSAVIGEKSLLSGLVRCGDCGRAMVTRDGNPRTYDCGSFRVFGEAVCTKHHISEAVLEELILRDLNQVVARTDNLDALFLSNKRSFKLCKPDNSNKNRLETEIRRLQHQKQAAYEDYRAKVLTRGEFIRCKAAYDAQEEALAHRLRECATDAPQRREKPWIEKVRKLGELTELDRETLEQTVGQIRVFEGNRIEITYLFSDKSCSAAYPHTVESDHDMEAATVSENRKLEKNSGDSYRVDRVFVGDRTAEEVVADLIKVHTGGA